MCGLYGVFAFGNATKPVSETEITDCRDMMRDRGPDGQGLWISDDLRIGFGHRRLSVIDLDARANQPLQSSDGRYIITFNGEIYNYKSLRQPLIEKGIKFKTESDTEVLIELYRLKGKAMLKDLRGMFAIAIYDTHEKTLLLARDAYGIKPLYMSNNDGTVRFCSQVKPIIGSGAVSTEPDSAGWVSFFLFGSVQGPFTTYRSIQSLPAGHYVEISIDDVVSAPEPYFEIKMLFQQRESVRIAEEERQEIIRAATLDSVKAHLIADVPVGLFLSAGIDSSALLGLMRDAGQSEISTITLGFEEFYGQPSDEGPLAAEIAEYYGVQHNLRYVSREEFGKDIPNIISAMDQPSVDGINTYFASKAAAEAGLKVVLSGVGGDELFGGYSSFKTVPKFKKFASRLNALPGLASGLASLSALGHRLAPSHIPPKLSGLLKDGHSWGGAYMAQRSIYLASQLSQVFDSEFVSEGLERLQAVETMNALVSGLKREHEIVSILESSYYMRNQLLRDSDWASMAHSLELRTPLVDKDLLIQAGPVSWDGGTDYPKSALSRSPLKPLPAKIANRKKTGFAIPVNDWLIQDERFSKWRERPHLAQESCPWAKRWAFEIASQTGVDLPFQ